MRRIRWFPQAMQAALQRPALARPRPLRKGGLQTRSMSTSNPSHVAQPLSSPNKTSQNQQAPPTRQETEKLFSSSSKSGANLSALQHPRLSHSHSLSTYTYIYIHIYVKNLYIYLHNGRVCSPNEGLFARGRIEEPKPPQFCHRAERRVANL